MDMGHILPNNGLNNNILFESMAVQLALSIFISSLLWGKKCKKKSQLLTQYLNCVLRELAVMVNC